MSTAIYVEDRFAGSRALRVVLTVTGFALLTAFGAQARIVLPFTPVPLTMQTFAVILAGLCLSPRDAFLSQMAYVTAGFAGLPFFAVAGPGTVGYLAGFVIAAPLISVLNSRGHAAFAGIAGIMVIHAAGCAGLVAFGFPAGPALFVAGSLVFLPGDILKAILAGKVARRFN